jgi:hypothetical protein
VLTFEDRLRRVESQLGALLEDARLGESMLGPFPVSESSMSLRRVDGTQCYVPGVFGPPSAWGTNSWAKDILMVFPFYVGSPINTDRFSFNVTVAAAGDLRMGVYDSSTDLYPTHLIKDVGISTHNSTGWLNIDFNKVLLTRGLKWIAMVQQGAPTLTTVLPADVWAILGRTQSIAQCCGWFKAFGYAALPSVFPADAETMSGASGIPFVEVRLVK